mmetsp:Transcript_18797/g.56576  ORF Transcript_18797/g.56576 Transcript_18797/m.56576 type:complete len:279 (+) Transcript_18797:561-1397(+)
MVVRKTVTLAVGEFRGVRDHELPCQQITLAVVPTEDVVILQVQLRILLEGRILEFPHSAPGLRLQPTIGHRRVNPSCQAPGEQRGEAVQPLVVEKTAEPQVGVVLCEGLVHVGACRQKDQAGTGSGIFITPVERLEELQATRIHPVLGERLVATGRELAAARVEGVVHVAQYLDAHAAASTLPVLGGVAPQRQRLLPEVQLDGLARPPGGHVLVDQLVNVVVVASGVDEVLQHRQLRSPATEKEAGNRLLVLPPQLDAPLLQRINDDGLLDHTEAPTL